MSKLLRLLNNGETIKKNGILSLVIIPLKRITFFTNKFNEFYYPQAPND